MQQASFLLAERRTAAKQRASVLVTNRATAPFAGRPAGGATAPLAGRRGRRGKTLPSRLISIKAWTRIMISLKLTRMHSLLYHVQLSCMLWCLTCTPLSSPTCVGAVRAWAGGLHGGTRSSRGSYHETATPPRLRGGRRGGIRCGLSMPAPAFAALKGTALAGMRRIFALRGLGGAGALRSAITAAIYPLRDEML